MPLQIGRREVNFPSIDLILASHSLYFHCCRSSVYKSLHCIGEKNLFDIASSSVSLEMQTLPLAEMHQREWLLQNQPDRVTTLQFCLDRTICLSLSIKHTCTSHISVISTHVHMHMYVYHSCKSCKSSWLRCRSSS